MNNKTKTRSLKVAIIAVALLLCLALAIGITGAFYQAKRQATGTLSMDQGIIIDYKGFGKTPDEGIWSRENKTTFLLFSETNTQPGEQIAVNAAGIRANAESVNFYARVKLSYKFYNGETPVEFAESTKLIKTSSSFFGTNWVESGDGYFYYATGTSLNKFNKGTQTFVDLFATDAKFIIEGAGFTGANNNGEGGGFVDGTTSINKIEVYLTLETLQGDADAAAEGWKITEVIKPVEVDVTTEEKPEINIDDIISDDKKDGEITIAGDPTAKKTILIGSRAFEGCTNLRLKLNNSTNITYIIASDAFSTGAKIWYGAAEATNLLINADTTGKTAGKDNAWVVAEPNLKVFLPTGVTQNSTNTSYGKYQYTDDQGTWYFDLLDSNGKTVTLSSNNNMSASTLGASTYANTNTYTAKLRKFVPKAGVTTVVIPKFIGISQDSDKYAVTELYETFGDCAGFTTITIPDSVTSIGYRAFWLCRGLTSITIPGSVTSIGGSAFEKCRGLTSVTIGSGVTSIGDYAFYSCSRLTSITIPDSVTSIGTLAFSDCSGLTSVTISDSVTSIGYSAFSGCHGLTSITIPDSVTSIGRSAFDDCSGLTSIHIGAGIQEVSWLPSDVSQITITISKDNPYLATDSQAIFTKSNGKLSVSKYISSDETYNIPSAVDSLSVTSIGSSAFYGCSGLTSVTIGSGVTSIGSSAFYGCSGLTSITIPDSVTSIGTSAFSDCSGLTSITIPDKVTSIGDYAFHSCSRLTSITIPDSVTSIGNRVFSSCNGLTSINVNSKNTKYHSAGNCLIETASQTLIAGCKTSIIPTDGVTSIGDYAFSGCSGLTSVTIGNGVTSIGKYAFSGCIGLTSITIPDSVTSIGHYAFPNCSGLTSITIPNSVTSIGNSAFSSCSSLTSITIPDSVTSIGTSAFDDCSGLTSIHIGAGIKAVGWLPSDVSQITITISKDNPYLATDSRAIFAKSNGELSVSEYISADTTYDIPSAVDGLSVTSIGDYAFQYCKGLTSITIPNSVTSIGKYAFYECKGLTSVKIGSGVTSIGASAFQNCRSLTSVVIKGNNITEVSRGCFKNCSNLESIVLPASVTTIGSGAFSSCSKLTTIYVDSANATAITNLGFAKVDGTLYNENGIEDASGTYYKYSGAIA